MPSLPGPDAQFQTLSEGLVDLISEEEFKSRLLLSQREKRPLRIKYGADPSSPDLHLGHTVPLRKLRQFQEAGHQVVFIIGDFTARIGDPSHRSETRPMLSSEQIHQNALTYQDQVFKILDKSKTEVRFNSEWLDQMKPQDFLHLTAQYTVARLLERDDFHKRFKANQPIAVIEFLYPLLQGYDSVVVQSDIELGGSDQKFNLLVGRELQKVWKQTPQIVMTLPLLEGTDGVRKMSKSFGNSIAVRDIPKEMFGKIMSIPDRLFPVYLNYVTAVPPAERKRWLESFGQDPREGKAALAEEITAFYWGRPAACEARQEFDRVFKNKEVPEDIQDIEMEASSLDIVSLLKEAGLVASKGEGRRLVEQGGVKIDQEKVTDVSKKVDLSKAVLVQCGKRKFARVHSRVS